MSKVKRNELWKNKEGENVTIIQNDVGNKHSTTTIVEKKGEILTIPQESLVERVEKNFNTKSFEKKLRKIFNENDSTCEIVYTNFGEDKTSSVQNGIRPAVMFHFKEKDLIIPLTSKLHKTQLPTHVQITKEYGLKRDSILLCEQVFLLERNTLKSDNKIANIQNIEIIQKIKEAIYISLDIRRF